MSRDAASVLRYQRGLIRESFRRDQAHQARIAPYLRGIARGDDHMACNRLPTQAVVDTLNHIFALWRTT